MPLFEKPADYGAFLRVVAEALAEQPMRILSFVLMPNHWHFLLWPEGDHVNAPQTDGELEALRRSLRRSCPFGSTSWLERIANRQGLSHTLRPLGRPKKVPPLEQPPPS